MSHVRPLEREDLTRVVDVYERVQRSGRPTPPPGLAPYFERTLLDHPWADPAIPSLVFETDDGRILGLIGSHVRRTLFDGEPIRMSCAGHLVSDPGQRNLAIGPRLLRSLLSGPQDLTITDGATALVDEMWVRLGGHTLQPESIVWSRLFRPARAVADRWLEREGRERWRQLAGPVWSLVDAPAARITRPPQHDAAVEVEELTARAFIEHQPEIAGDARLRVDYDEPFVHWLFSELAAVSTRGRLVRRLLRRNGRLLGWYIAYLKSKGLSQVIQVAATKGAVEAVLDRLFADAWQSGAAGLEGRLEPTLFEPLCRRRCLLRPSSRALFHTRDPEIAAAMALGRSAFTRLDGEWWMGHHTESFA